MFTPDAGLDLTVFIIYRFLYNYSIIIILSSSREQYECNEQHLWRRRKLTKRACVLYYST